MKQVSPNIAFPLVEEEILKDWDKNQTFYQQEEKRKSSKSFSFYDGPPFANGLPHYGHLLANTIKDCVPRYWSMKGFRVRRRFGWDCHGLPVEFEVEKQKNLKGRSDIVKMGIDVFNETCRESVLHYTQQWQETIIRMGRWVDWKDQYRTMDKEFMESVWWVFGELYKKNLIYQDYKVVPYSPRTASVVSNFEANQNYKDIQDPSIWIKFELKEMPNTHLIAWTTTPWTLPSNLALAVGEEITYIVIKDHESQQQWIIAKECLHSFYEDKLKTLPHEDVYTIVQEISGSKLVGNTYKPLFPYFKDQPNAFKVLAADYVTTSDGTGIVHQAPAYGEDDFYTCKKANISIVDPIDEQGNFTNEIEELSGSYFKDADKLICKLLKQKDSLIKHATIVHSYPFDERTDTPLMFKAVPSWYVAVEKIVDKLVANNQKINWIPGHLKNGRMGSWLKGARDWAISRNRFWGTPLPVWICKNNAKHMKVIASIAELKEACGKDIVDIHSHFLKDIEISCPECTGKMKIVDVVFDCWFESGSMPYAQLHYPFENIKTLEQTFPADFIAEGLDQTRGWFYTLTVLATALFDKPAFKNVIVNGVILDERGKKMSKRHRNYTAPGELIKKFGADSIRLYMLNSPLLKADDLIFLDKGVKDTTRQVLIPLWNAYSFLSTYAVADNWQADADLLEGKVPDVSHDFDLWIISRLQSLVKDVATHMQEYKLYLVVSRVLSFIEDLTNWYIRLNRRRFWGAGEKLTKDQSDAYRSLFYVLAEFTKILAPYAPFISDRIYKNLFSERKNISVHLCDMPELKEEFVNLELEKRMDLLRIAINQGRSLRQKHKIKIRQALLSMTIVVASEKDKNILTKGDLLLKRELNVKNIIYTTDETAHVRLTLKPNFKTLGKKLGKNLRNIQKHLLSLNNSHTKVNDFLKQLSINGSVTVADYNLSECDILMERAPIDDRLISTDQGVTILFDTSLTEELIREGWSRELVNRVQNLRKDSGLEVSDRIDLEIIVPQELASALSEYREYIMQETLAKNFVVNAQEGECSLKFIKSSSIEKMTCVIALEVNKGK
jgi:isoleucyl-tRNA synthetase